MCNYDTYNSVTTLLSFWREVSGHCASTPPLKRVSGQEVNSRPVNMSGDVRKREGLTILTQVIFYSFLNWTVTRSLNTDLVLSSTFSLYHGNVSFTVYIYRDILYTVYRTGVFGRTELSMLVWLSKPVPCLLWPLWKWVSLPWLGPVLYIRVMRSEKCILN